MNIEALFLQSAAFDALAKYFNSRFGMVGYRDQTGYAYLEAQIAACKAERDRLGNLAMSMLVG